MHQRIQAASHSGWDGTVSYSDTWGWRWCWETYEADGLVAVEVSELTYPRNSMGGNGLCLRGQGVLRGAQGPVQQRLSRGEC